MLRASVKSAFLTLANVIRMMRSASRQPHPRFVDIQEILSSGTSIIRWGDGETSLLLMKSLGFQRASLRLALELCRILIRQEKNYVVCMPPHLYAYRRLVSDARYRSIWAETICLWELLSWRLGAIVSDACAFRKEARDRSSVLMTLLRDCDVCCVLSKNPQDCESISRVTNRHVIHVRCPQKNAFSHYGEMRLRLLEALGAVGGDPKSPARKKRAVLISAGPAGKVLIRDLASSIEYQNVQFLDVGHLFDHGLPQ